VRPLIYAQKTKLLDPGPSPINSLHTNCTIWDLRALDFGDDRFTCTQGSWQHGT
jgi:hypothetical protein